MMAYSLLMDLHFSRTYDTFSAGIAHTPESSATIKAPGSTTTLYRVTGPLTSTACIRHFPEIGVVPRLQAGKFLLLNEGTSRIAPLTTAPTTPRDWATQTDCPPIFDTSRLPPKSATSTSPGSAR